MNTDRIPLPAEVRNLRVLSGATYESIMAAASYKTKRSVWMIETGRATMPAWRWNALCKVLGNGELIASEYATRHTHKTIEFGGDPLIFISEDQRIELGKAVENLSAYFGLTPAKLGALCHSTGATMRKIFKGKSRQLTTSKRVAIIKAGLLKLKANNLKSVNTYLNALDPNSITELRTLRLNLRISQGQAGKWTFPNSVDPDALLSAYECESINMSLEARKRYAKALLDWHQLMLADPGWDVLARAPIGIKCS